MDSSKQNRKIGRIGQLAMANCQQPPCRGHFTPGLPPQLSCHRFSSLAGPPPAFCPQHWSTHTPPLPTFPMQFTACPQENCCSGELTVPPLVGGATWSASQPSAQGHCPPLPAARRHGELSHTEKRPSVNCPGKKGGKERQWTIARGGVPIDGSLWLVGCGGGSAVKWAWQYGCCQLF